MKQPLAHIYIHTNDAVKYDVRVVFRDQPQGKGCAIAGIIWLQQPTEIERLSAICCMCPGGFELVAKNYDNNT